MIRYLFAAIFFLSFSTVIWAQENDEVALRVRIADIKMDERYLYGDATMKDRDEAEAFACLLLSDEAEKYGLSFEPKLEDVTILSHKRGSMWRVFAYICKDSITGVYRHSVRDGMNDGVLLLEELLCSAKTIASLSLEVEKNEVSSTITMGRVDNGTDPGLIEASYIVVSDSQNGKIKVALSPLDGDSMRTNVKTGEKQSNINYKRGDVVSWIHL